MGRRWILTTVAGAVLAGCSAAAPAAPASSTSAWTYGPAAPAATVAEARVIEVYKSPTCSCCHEWEAYLEAQGYVIRSFPVADLAAVKAERGVPQAAFSCHTAVIDGYVVEGHVPVAAIEDLLADRPSIDGIALPAMPAGSPGMPGVQAAPFEVLALRDGETSLFGTY